MIIILEGANGVGKSTYANLLKEMYGIPICRPFRFGDSNIHWGSNGQERFQKLKRLGIPINTHIDDLYAADFLAAFQVDAILDRPLTSGIAYGRVFNQDDGWYNRPGVATELLSFWSEMIGNCVPPIVYVWLDARYEVAKYRCRERWCPNKKNYQALQRAYDKIFHTLKFEKKKIMTDKIEIADGVRMVKRMIEAT